MEHISKRIVAFLPKEEIEPEAMEQIENTASMPFLYRHVAVMPDTHYGKGSTVGTVLPTHSAIIPAAVGVDIGCGMIAVKTNIIYEGTEASRAGLAEIRKGIERRIPMSAGRFNDKITETAQERIAALEDLAQATGVGVAHYDEISRNWRNQLGTLGGGNHFIELCIDKENRLWVTLHSGSRGIGNKIGNMYIAIAQKKCSENFIQLPDPDLAYLVEGTPEFRAYMLDLNWAQFFALLNREEMMDRVLAQLADTIHGDYKYARAMEVDRINCHHNFTQQERHFNEVVWITRKGAIEASEGKRGMIPGSMGTPSYIVRGKGCAMSFHSAPHGAGRRMSRGKAKAAFSMEDFDKAMQGIEHRRSEILLDELPGAYKDIHQVIENAHELIEVETMLTQILNVKGD
jgi:tRNA-splicing ligase RtcB